MLEEKVIEIKRNKRHSCQHNKFIVSPEKGYVECGVCGEHLNPLWVIEQYANAEHRLFQKFERLSRLCKELENKTKCRCDNCGKMTKIYNQKEANKTFYG